MVKDTQMTQCEFIILGLGNEFLKSAKLEDNEIEEYVRIFSEIWADKLMITDITDDALKTVGITALFTQKKIYQTY